MPEQGREQASLMKQRRRSRFDRILWTYNFPNAKRCVGSIKSILDCSFFERRRGAEIRMGLTRFSRRCKKKMAVQKCRLPGSDPGISVVVNGQERHPPMSDGMRMMSVTAPPVIGVSRICGRCQGDLII